MKVFAYIAAVVHVMLIIGALIWALLGFAFSAPVIGVILIVTGIVNLGVGLFGTQDPSDLRYAALAVFGFVGMITGFVGLSPIVPADTPIEASFFVFVLVAYIWMAIGNAHEDAPAS